MAEEKMRKTGLLEGSGENDGEETGSGVGGNVFLKLPYGLAKSRSLNTDGMRPREVWDLLKGYGVNKEEEEKKLKEKLDGVGSAPKQPENVAKKYNKAAEAYKKISLSGIEKSFAGEIENRLLDLANTYGVDFTGMEVKGTANSREFGHHIGQLDKDKNGNIYFKDSLTYSNLNMRDKNTSLSKHQAEAKYRGSKNVSGLSTVDHEIAHAIDIQYVLKSNANLQKAVNFYNGVKLSKDSGTYYTQINQINAINSLLHSDETNLSGKVKKQLMTEYHTDERGFKELVRKELGTYALTNTAEFFAEGFSAYKHIPKEQQSEFVKKFGEYTEKNIKEVFNNGTNR